MLIDVLKKEFLGTHKNIIVIQQTLKTMPYGSMYTVKRKGRMYYYHEYYTKERRVQKYVKLAEVEALREQLAISKELKGKLRDLEKDLRLLRQFLRKMKIDADQLLKEDEDQTAAREKERREKRQRMHSAMMDTYDNKRFCTNRGDLVRSKSEMIIANLLAQNGIEYEYERPWVRGQYRFHPDFTIETDYETYYLEHCGMMNDPKYRDRWDFKRRIYAEYGIREGKNLIITYDSEDGVIDSQEIQRQIDIYLK